MPTFDDLELQAVVDRLPECVLVVDDGGHVTAANAAAERLLGYAPETLIGRPVETLVPDRWRHRHTDLRQAYARDPAVRRMGADRIVSARHHSGETVDVEVSLAPLDDDGLNTLVVLRGTALEVARHQQMDAELELVIAMARGVGVDVTLQIATERACNAVHADAAWLWLAGPDGRLSMVAGADHGHDVVAGVHIGVVLDEIDERDSVAVLDAARPGHPLDGYTSLGYGPMIIARVGSDATLGLLVLARSRGRTPFEPSHRALSAEFAAIVAVALDLDASRAALGHLAVVDDRDRIARELHDSVIQRLYADGLHLSAVANSASPEVAAQIRAVIGDLEVTSAELRSAILALGRVLPGVPLAELIRQLLDDFAAPGRLATSLEVEDELDARLSAELRHHSLNALRECLANVVRHANASKVAVSVGVRGGHLVVAVADDGVGPPDLPSVRGHGLQNLTARAVALGGRFELERSDPSGTVAVWTVPVT